MTCRNSTKFEGEENTNKIASSSHLKGHNYANERS